MLSYFLPQISCGGLVKKGHPSSAGGKTVGNGPTDSVTISFLGN